MNLDETACRRKERRFETCPGQTLACRTIVAGQDAAGTVIDISPSGLRLLCEGNFQVGQSFSTELTTDQSHGSYRGVIRRVQPWMGGQSILGCQLSDKIPDEVLGDLAHRGIVNRRRDPRVPWQQAAKMSWELHAGEIDIEIHDCSAGGLKISARQAIPDNVRLRICVDTGDPQPMVINARSVWQRQQEGRYLAGLTFTTLQVPEVVARVLSEHARQELSQHEESRSLFRRSVLVATAVVVFGLALWQTGLWS